MASATAHIQKPPSGYGAGAYAVSGEYRVHAEFQYAGVSGRGSDADHHHRAIAIPEAAIAIGASWAFGIFLVEAVSHWALGAEPGWLATAIGFGPALVPIVRLLGRQPL